MSNAPVPNGFLQSISLTIKSLLLTISVGVILWVVLDYLQGKDIQALFIQELLEGLQTQAKEDRALFDKHIQSHQKAAKLIVSQKRFQDYVLSDNWKDAEVHEHYRPPQWLPSSSVMRAFFPARQALLIDDEGNVQEVYYNAPDELPETLKQPGTLMQQLSHNQSYMTMIEGRPFVLAAQSLRNDRDKTIATLMLISPIDDEFLIASQGTSRPEGLVVALLEGQPERIMASSNPDAFTAGALVESLNKDFLKARASGFFDYGASDLELQFASFVATEQAYHISNQILAKAKEQRVVFALVLVISFSLLIAWIAQQIRRLTKQITVFSQESLGIDTYQTNFGDEIHQIISSFQLLRDSIANTIERANAIASGNYSREAYAHHSAQDQLGQALTHMNNTLQEQAEHLRHQQEELRNLNEDLELRVKERTLQLETANGELQTALETVKRTQKQLVEAEKMSALGGLVAGVAHEINTPIGVGVTAASTLDERVKAFTELFESGQLKKTDLRKFLAGVTETSNIILPNLHRAAELIRSFKQIAVDQTSLELREFHVKTYLDEILLSLRPKLKKTQHQLVIDCPEQLHLYTHAGNFSQIITNLIVNTLVHAYDEGQTGHISITVTENEEKNRLLFHYHDDGKGIPQENLSKIFDPFFTTARSKGGSGLGLSIIYNIVTQNMNGDLRCESEESKGTDFYFEIPVNSN